MEKNGGKNEKMAKNKWTKLKRKINDNEEEKNRNKWAKFEKKGQNLGKIENQPILKKRKNGKHQQNQKMDKILKGEKSVKNWTNSKRTKYKNFQLGYN